MACALCNSGWFTGIKNSDIRKLSWRQAGSEEKYYWEANLLIQQDNIVDRGDANPDTILLCRQRRQAVLQTTVDDN